MNEFLVALLRELALKWALMEQIEVMKQQHAALSEEHEKLKARLAELEKKDEKVGTGRADPQQPGEPQPGSPDH